MSEGRLFKIIYYLLEKGRATAPELAEKFEVSIRTIYRDVDSLSSAGIPIYVTAGRKGGIQLLDHFVLHKSILSDKEKQEILMGLQSLGAIQYQDAEDILTKLGAVFQTAQIKWIEADLSRWGTSRENEQKIFQTLKQSILESRVISFTYYSSSGTGMKREAEPLKLFYKERAWYLYAYCRCRSGNRLFRISRMKEITLTNQVFSRQMETADTVFPMTEDMGAIMNIELQFPEEMAYRIYDIFDDQDIAKLDKGYRVTASVPENQWIYEFIMSFGDQVEIISPKRLRENIIERCRRALQHHRKE